MIRIAFNEGDKAALNYERYNHPHPFVQQKMEVLWLKSQGMKHKDICRMADVCSTTLTSYVKEYAEGGIEAVKTVKFNRPRGELDDHRETLEEYFRTHPPATVKEAMAAIEKLTGLKRSHERTRKFLKRIGMKLGRGPGPRHPWCRAVSWKRHRSDLLKSSSDKCLLLLRLWGCGQPVRVVQAQRHIHSLCAERDAGAPDRHRRPVCQRLVRAPMIVKSQPFGDPSLGLLAIGVAFGIDVLVFQAAPQPLDEHIVDPAAAAVHRDADAGGLQPAGKLSAGELAPLVGVEDLRLAEASQRVLQRRKAERDVHRIRQSPCQDGPTGPVDDRHQIEKPPLNRDVGNVCRPDMVWPLDYQVAQQIREDLVAWRGFCRARFRSQRGDAHLPHQPLHPLAVDLMSFGPQQRRP